MDILNKIDKLLTENNDLTPVFETYEEASDYLYKNYKGHGKIKHHPSGKLIRTCKCRQNHVTVYSKEDPHGCF